MIKNNKGFMMVEVIIVSTIIVTILITLYTSFFKLFILYTNRSRYYNIDGVYAIKEITNYLIIDNRLNNILSSLSSDSDSIFLINDSECNSILPSDDEFCEQLQNLYQINNLVITKKDNILYNDGTSLTYLGRNDLNINETFKDYLKYLYKYYSNNDEYDYLIILEYNSASSNNLNYSNLRLR